MVKENVGMIKAVIDLGTNTFNLLIGELVAGDLKIIHSEKIPVMLGMGGINEGKIADDAFQRGLSALSLFKSKAEAFKVKSIIGIATSAVRSSSNGNQFVKEVKEKLDIDIHVVDGLSEADLIFKGVNLTMDIDKDSVIMDIGGGSTEFIRVADQKISEMVSLNIGVSRVYQGLGKPDDYSQMDIDEIWNFLEKEGAGHFNYNVDVLIGASGTFETIWEMINEKEYVSSDKAIQIDKSKFDEVINWSISASLQERNAHPWIVEMRKRMLPVGAVKLKWIVEKLGITEIWISPYSLKEGAFVS